MTGLKGLFWWTVCFFEQKAGEIWEWVHMINFLPRTDGLFSGQASGKPILTISMIHNVIQLVFSFRISQTKMGQHIAKVLLFPGISGEHAQMTTDTKEVITLYVLLQSKKSNHGQHTQFGMLKRFAKSHTANISSLHRSIKHILHHFTLYIYILYQL